MRERSVYTNQQGLNATAKRHMLLCQIPYNKLLLSPLRGWDLRSGAAHLHYGPKAKRYV